MAREEEEEELPFEVAIVGELTDQEADITDKLLGVPRGGECTLYFDSPGGNPYTAISLANLILVRRLRATGIVTGECSSAALWPFAACQRRLVTPLSMSLFHPVKWQSEENVGIHEAVEWARHFRELEADMDALLAKLFGCSEKLLLEWSAPGKYISGLELAKAGIVELVEIADLAKLQLPGDPPSPKRARKR
jgi:ATP-dependent Clp protease protease subunit